MIRFTAALLMMAFLQADCESPLMKEFPSLGTAGRATSFTVDTPDGRRVVCISWIYGTYAGGVSCDWAGAKPIKVETESK